MSYLGHILLFVLSFPYFLLAQENVDSTLTVKKDSINFNVTDSVYYKQLSNEKDSSNIINSQTDDTAITNDQVYQEIFLQDSTSLKNSDTTLYNFNTDSIVNVKKQFLQISGGPSSYKGDLNHFYSKWFHQVGVSIVFHNRKLINSQVNFSFGKVVANNPNYNFQVNDTYVYPNQYAQINYFSLNYQLNLTLLNYKKWHLYAYQGFGLFKFNPMTESEEKLINLQSTRALGENYNTSSITLPHGFGLRFYMTPNFAIGYYNVFYNVQTDYLDNISQWGNKSTKDQILSHQLFLLFNLKN